MYDKNMSSTRDKGTEMSERPAPISIPNDGRAIFTLDGRTYRAALISFHSDGEAWVWCARVTVKGTDYKNGDGIHLTLTNSFDHPMVQARGTGVAYVGAYVRELIAEATPTEVAPVDWHGRTFGQLTPDEKRAVTREAAAKLQTQLNAIAPAIAAELATVTQEASERVSVVIHSIGGRSETVTGTVVGTKHGMLLVETESGHGTVCVPVDKATPVATVTPKAWVTVGAFTRATELDLIRNVYPGICYAGCPSWHGCDCPAFYNL